jgi:hypothetical protein
MHPQAIEAQHSFRQASSGRPSPDTNRVESIHHIWNAMCEEKSKTKDQLSMLEGIPLDSGPDVGNARGAQTQSLVT